MMDYESLMPCGDETYMAGTGEMAMPTNGGNYGTTPAPESSGSTPSPQGETTFMPGPGGQSSGQSIVTGAAKTAASPVAQLPTSDT